MTDAELGRVARKAEIAQILIEHGGDCDLFSATKLSCFHMAALLPGFSVVTDQFKTYGRYLTIPEFPASELICLAATQGNIPMLAFLRKEGFNIDLRDDKQRTAL